MSEKKYSREEIVEALERKKAKNPCHRCGNAKFVLIDDFSKLNLYADTDSSNSESSVPVVLIGCDNCGAITPHALYALVDKKGEKVEESKKGKNKKKGLKNG